MSTSSSPSSSLTKVELDEGSVIYVPRGFMYSRASRAALRRRLDAADAQPCYYGMDAFFLADPKGFKWSIVQGNDTSRVVIFERTLPSGTVRMNYYFTTGTVQLIHDNRHYRGVGGPSDPRRVQETYRDLTEQEFVNLLRNPPNFFRKGWAAPPCNGGRSSSQSSNDTYYY